MKGHIEKTAQGGAVERALEKTPEKTAERESTAVRLDYFSIGQICGSGQCFRMTEQEPGRYQVVARGRRLEMVQDGGTVTFFCGREEYEAVWRPYFDLDTDYGAYLERTHPATDTCRGPRLMAAGSAS